MAKTAVILTGAGARIAQQTALLYQLDRKWAEASWWGPSADDWKDNTRFSDDTVCIAGTSSGGLNLTALNAVWNPANDYGWDQFIHFLISQLTNDSIRTPNPDFPPIPPVFRTDAFRQTLLEQMTYMRFDSLGNKEVPLGALVYPSYITTVHFGLPPREYYLSSWDDWGRGDHRISLADALLCTSAIPIVFPSCSLSPSAGSPLSSELPEKPYVDGGLFDGVVPFKPILDRYPQPSQKLQRLLIVSPMRAQVNPADFLPDHSALKNPGLSSIYRFWINSLNLRRVVQRIRKIPEIWKPHTYVYLPDLTFNYGILDFSAEEQKKQFIEALDWSESHVPLRLDVYLKHIERLYPGI